ncbi:MAG: phosphate regulon sensor histidine kinase PhoR [Gammaproteobacteria bacterium]
MKSRLAIRAAGRLLLVVGLALGAGLVFGGPLIWLVSVLVLAVFWHIYNVYRLERWLNLREGKLPRTAPGVWGLVYMGMHRLRSRSRQRKKGLTRAIKEFRKSSAALPDASVVLNRDNEIVWLNRAATDLLGIRKTDRGLRIDTFIREPAFIRYLREGEEAGPVHFRSLSRPGARMLLRLVPYGGEGQQLLLGRDITDRIRMEKMRRDFVANASHELRSPLTVITGYLDSLESDQTLPPDWRQPVADMSHQAARMRAIIDDLLTLSRLESGAQGPGDDAVDVAGLLALIRKETLVLQHRPQKIELDVQSQQGLRGSENELYSAFANLVANAVKYTPVDGQVAIRWSVDDDGGRLSVTDTGRGIPADAIPRLTERFYRVHKGRDRASGGTGLGLAIVKHVLERHQATLEIESELGKGSRFCCHFPISRLTPPRGVADPQQN